MPTEIRITYSRLKMFVMSLVLLAIAAAASPLLFVGSLKSVLSGAFIVLFCLVFAALLLYTAAVRQIPGLIWHFLPQLPKLLGKGSGWTGENEAYFDDKYIPIVPQQGAFLYMQALAKGAKNIVEFGTSYGISTLYLAAAAKKNGGRVITTEHLPHKAEAARRHFAATSPPLRRRRAGRLYRTA